MAYIVQNGKMVKKVKGFVQKAKMVAHSPDYAGVANVNTGAWKVPVQNGMAIFTAHGEAEKMLQGVIQDPAPGRVYSSDKDLAQLPFSNNTAGFFIAILPTQPDPNNANNRGFLTDLDYVDDAKVIMNHFTNKVPLGDGLYMISSYATWDMAQKHYKDIHRVFGFAVIGFSTPKNLQILAEDPEHYKAQRAA
jgi:hypothetical protein